MKRHSNEVDMKNNGIDNNFTETNQVAEEQFAHGVFSLLDDHAQNLTAAKAKRLSIARGLAVSHLASLQTDSFNHSGNILQLFGSNVERYIERHRILSAAVIASALLFAFFAAQHIEINNNLENSDAFLLASDLPPEAYADKGFDTWLVSKRE